MLASPSLSFLAPDARLELSPGDAQRLELFDGQRATVAGVEATIVLRDSVPEGSAFLEGNSVDPGLVEVRRA